MGHLYAKVKHVKYRDEHDHRTAFVPIKILKTEAKIDNHPTLIDEESSAVLKYRTPYFRFLFKINFVFQKLKNKEHNLIT